MKKKILIVEDEFIEANNLQMILERAGYNVCKLARSVPVALEIVDSEKPDLVLLDICLKGNQTGIDLAKILREKNIAFVYLSANSDKEILAQAKATQPYGFLVKPFREKDVLVTLDIADYLHEQKLKLQQVKEKDAAPKPLVDLKGIIGRNKGLQAVLDHVKIVAPTDTSVLITGESGTGKERIVDSIHASSHRNSKPLIKVNCAVLPATLIESELFGHERGSFTGAFEKRIGKFEQAQGGTIFLDEIGEMPLDLQVKLLRVLQEKEIERIGGKGSIKVDVRFIAATNRNLEKEVAEGRFRIDLFYRLNVFPIHVPPLRNRKDDIPLLAAHFVDRYAAINRKKITGISENAIDALMAHDWPGNIRELEHLIERSVLLTQGDTLQSVPLSRDNYQFAVELPVARRVKTMEESEIDHIVEVLRLCKGKISGPGGAAELLDLPYSTLSSRIKKLGIKKESLFK
ncbi:hypothetical protein GCM10023149_09430 [Mucilaginibacter gynuensis]|uniref:DNA-binding NtrC family response regulator n=1 Tax=Mucilaginibacter gynuensis TaxID=1302236 RepID=A0ABP8FYY9_9SPHI